MIGLNRLEGGIAGGPRPDDSEGDMGSDHGFNSNQNSRPTRRRAPIPRPAQQRVR